MEREYHKIDTVFERDMQGSKKLIEGKFRSPIVEYLANNQWIFTEKVDGTNVRIFWDGHKVSIGGRTNNAQMPIPLMERLTALFKSNEAEQLFEQKFGATQVYLYGEGYGGKIQSGSDYSETQDFCLFDAQVGFTFLERQNVEDLAVSFGVKTAPVMLRGTIADGISFVKAGQKSLLAQRPKLIEGIVGTPAVRLVNGGNGSRVIVKIKACDFMESK